MFRVLSEAFCWEWNAGAACEAREAGFSPAELVQVCADELGDLCYIYI